MQSRSTASIPLSAKQRHPNLHNVSQMKLCTACNEIIILNARTHITVAKNTTQSIQALVQVNANSLTKQTLIDLKR